MAPGLLGIGTAKQRTNISGIRGKFDDDQQRNKNAYTICVALNA